MSEEIFDVVNERDEVTGQAPRNEVHRLGLPHRAVHVLIRNSKGEFFLQLRSRQKDREPGVWDSSSSGHVDSGEDYDEAARREVREELGWQADSAPRRLFKIAASPATDQEFVWVYLCEGEGPFSLNQDEIQRGGWFTPEHIDEWMGQSPHEFATGFRTLWRKVREGTI